MTGTAKVIWKTEAAKDAFSELIQLANIEKSHLIYETENDSRHSEYEKKVIKIQISEAYHRMVSGAYQTATSIETRSLQLQADIAATFGRA